MFYVLCPYVTYLLSPVRAARLGANTVCSLKYLISTCMDLLEESTCARET
jgi:hypothetical protein